MSQAEVLDIADALQEAGVQVVIIGGHAVNFHGYLRATEDVDLVFRRLQGVEEILLQVLTDWKAFWISDEIDPATGLETTIPVSLEFIRSNHLMMLGTQMGYVDLFDFIPGLPSENLDGLFSTAVSIGQRRFASLEWLKRMKRAAGRPQDEIDLRHLP